MKIIFGLALNDPPLPPPSPTEGGTLYLGPKGLLYTLESLLGLGGHPADNEFLRIEEYRQALRRYLEQHPDAFFGASFAADQFATATEMLSRRDELMLAGWDFNPKGAPPRLACLAIIEERLRSHPETSLSPGFADRLVAILERLHAHPSLPVTHLRLVEPIDLLPAYYRTLLHLLEGAGIAIEGLPEPPPQATGDLGRLQRQLVEPAAGGKIELEADGSLLVLRGKRENDLAAFLAACLRRNPGWQPALLIPEKNRALHGALIK